MSQRAPGCPNQGINRGRASLLPPQTHQIMDAFLWGKKIDATKYEQRKHEEVQSKILSRLRRSTVQTNENVQSLVPRQPQLSISKKYENASNKMHWNGLQRPVLQPNEEVQPFVPRQPRLDLSNDSGNASNETHWNELQRSVVQSEEEAQPLTSRKPRRSSLNSDENAANNSFWYGADQNTMMNHQSNDRQSKSHTPNNRQLSVQDGDEEEIVCCDGSHCHEGTKNLCTISLWAFIVFVIVNRFFVHMAMHLHKNENMTPEYIGVTGSEVGPQSMQHMEAKSNFTENFNGNKGHVR
mmetsp:Transcript_5817/g.12790  ORF Transcript_5817/g.12790 Transcript_5817/m.12790 type:complete len:296 (+) Transcript_5817:162-1049(+)